MFSNKYGTGAIWPAGPRYSRIFEFANKFNYPLGPGCAGPPPHEGKEWQGYLDDGHRDQFARPEISVNGPPDARSEKEKIPPGWIQKIRPTRASTTNSAMALQPPSGIGGEQFPIVGKTGADGHPYHESRVRNPPPPCRPPLRIQATPDGPAPPRPAPKGLAKPSDGSTARHPKNYAPNGRKLLVLLRYLDARTPRPFCSRPQRNTGWGDLLFRGSSPSGRLASLWRGRGGMASGVGL